MSLPRIISHLHKLWLGISWVMLFSNLALCLFHKCLQHISKSTSVFHTHPEVMISTARCLLAGRNIFFCLFRASTLHLPVLGLVWRRTFNSHSPSTLFMAVSMFITLLLNHPFSREELSSVHPLCTWKVFSLSLITIFTAHPCTSSSFITPIRDEEHIPGIAIHGYLQQYDSFFLFTCISAQQVPVPHLLWMLLSPELVISLGQSSEGRGRDVSRLCICASVQSALPLLICGPGILRLMAQSLRTEQVWVGQSKHVPKQDWDPPHAALPALTKLG